MTSGEHGPVKRLRITLRRSAIGHPRRQKETARALGLTRLGRAVLRPDNPAVRGMARAIQHLVSVEEVAPAAKRRAAKAPETASRQAEEDR